jgi:hypothetical protein|tara:strand:- start:13839 stop:14849 length:1011 start_codon:yes stop_codon:yes gene_type:complete
LFFFACEDEDEKDRPKDLVGTWYMHELSTQLKMTSKIEQTGIDPYSKGTSSLSVKVGTSDILLDYIMIQYDYYTQERIIGLSNFSAYQMSDEQEYPSVMLGLGNDEFQGKIAMLQAMLSEDEYSFYMNTSDYSFDEKNYSVSMTDDTLYAINTATGEMDPSNFVVLSGSFKAKGIQFSENVSITTDFLFFDMLESEETMKLEENGNATMTSYDPYDGMTDVEQGEWYAEGDNLYIILEVPNDYDQSMEMDTIAAKYVVNGTDLSLSREADLCDEVFDDDCASEIEMMFNLELNSLSELNIFQEIKFNQTPHAANRQSMKKFDVDQMLDQFRQFKLK